MSISTQYGANPYYFGHADYGGNIAAGNNPLQILNYLNQNLGRLRGVNVPGSGGIYDIAMREANTYRQQQEQLNAQKQQANFQQQIQQQQQQFQQQLAAQQEQAKEAQQQLMIQMNKPERAPAEVRMAGGTQQQQQLRKRGTTGYFGRQGLRIGSLNVPNPGMQMSAGAAMQPASGTFV